MNIKESIVNPKYTESIPINPQSGSSNSTGLRIRNSISAKIQLDSKLTWLLPETNPMDEIEDIDIDDEYVEKLLLEGGPSPSQLNYPGLYSQFATIATRLKNVRFLCIEIQNMSIYSTQYCIRKAYCQLQLKPPIGYCMKNDSPERIIDISKIIQMNEEKKQLYNTSSTSPSSVSRRGTMNDYQVGSLELDEVVIWDMNITNDIIHTWMEDSTRNHMLRIELKSCVTLPIVDNQSNKLATKSKSNNKTIS